MKEIFVPTSSILDTTQMLESAEFDFLLKIESFRSKDTDGVVYQQLDREEMIDVLIRERFRS